MSLFKSFMRVAACFTLVSASCFAFTANAAQVAKTFAASDFNSVRTSSQFNVNITTGAGYNIEVNAPEKLMPYVKVEINDGRLSVGLEKNAPKVTNANLECSISMPTLTYVSASGQSNVTVKGTCTDDKLTLTAKGQSNIGLSNALDVKDLVIDANGQSNVEVDKSTATHLQVTANGQSRVKAIGVNAADGEIVANGQSILIFDEIRASKLDAEADGQSTIRIHALACPNYTHQAEPGSVIKVMK